MVQRFNLCWFQKGLLSNKGKKKEFRLRWKILIFLDTVCRRNEWLEHELWIHSSCTKYAYYIEWAFSENSHFIALYIFYDISGRSWLLFGKSLNNLAVMCFDEIGSVTGIPGVEQLFLIIMRSNLVMAFWMEWPAFFY